MRRVVWNLALVCLTACAAESGGTARDEGGSASNDEQEDGWWVEIDAAGMEIPRLEGWVVVASVAAGRTSNVRGADAGLNRVASFSMILADFPGGTGTLENQAVTVWYQGEPAHTCRSRQIKVEVASTDPFQAAFEGQGECWEGEDVAPDDPNNPGLKLVGVEATIRGQVVE